MQLVRHLLLRRQQRPRRGLRGRPEDREGRQRDGADQRQGFTLYSFAPDTSTTSKCNGTCAQNWPPVKGPATASGVKGAFATIERSDESTQLTFHGHPLYTFVGDKSPEQASGNGVNAFGGLWHQAPASGSAAPASTSSPGGGGGYGY
jgi:predicted lipoprotein with Yx(FWY)xxD motif